MLAGSKMSAAVTLVIPGKNCGATIQPCLDAVIGMVGNADLHEIIFVDDASTDDTATIVAGYPVRYLSGDGGGRGSARNIGWQAANTPLIWFIDSDCVAEPDALSRLRPHLNDIQVAGVGGSYGNMRPDSLLACLIHEEIVARHRRMPMEVDYLATFNVLYRREVLETVGGFAHLPRGQDIDLCYQIHEAGYRMRFEAKSRVKHFHPTHWRRYFQTQARHGYFRVWLYVSHPARVSGDAYSGPLDYIQPPLAMLLLASIPCVVYPGVRWIPVLILVILLAAQLPMTWDMVRRTRDPRHLMFIVMGSIRAIYRGLGLTVGVGHALLTRGRGNPIRRTSEGAD